MKIKRIDNSIEEKILTGMIVSKSFCRDVIPMIDFNYFQVEYIRRISRWVVEYYKKYDDCPGEAVEDIFATEKRRMDEAEAELTESFLLQLSQKYSEQAPFNSQYYFDGAEAYFDERSLHLLKEGLDANLERGHLDKAAELVRDFKKVQKTISSWKNPLDEDYVDKVFARSDENILFKFDGELGRLFGYFEREWLISVMAPEKVGKTFFLSEICWDGLLSGLKIALIELEMSDVSISKRLYKRMTGLGDERRDHRFPCFDCYLNQDGSCTRKERQNSVILLDEQGQKPEFVPGMKYKTCTYCREKKLRSYIPATWFVVEEKGILTKAETKRYVSAVKKMYGDNLRLIAYPIKTANLSRIKNDLDVLEYIEDFVPDVVVIDYADLLEPEDNRVVGRDAINDTWMALKRAAQERHCLVATGSQTTALSAKKKDVTSQDTSEDKRKKAHIDLGAFISQTEEEKRNGVARLSKFFRHGDFDEHKHVQILQHLYTGQVLLDSEKVKKFSRKE